MKKMYHQIAAFVLAGALLLGVSSDMITTADAAPAGQYDIELSYPPNVSADTKAATILVGGTIDVNIKKNITAMEGDPPLLLAAQGKDQIKEDEFNANQKKYINIPITGSDNNKTIMVMPAFLDIINPTAGGAAILAVNGNYAAQLYQGNAMSGGVSTSVTVTEGGPLSILRISQMTVKCTVGESDTQPPKFSIKDPTGYFNGFNEVFWDGASDRMDTFSTPAQVPTRNIILKFQKGGNNFTLKIPLNVISTELDSAGEKVYTNRIDQDLEIVISFSPPNSNELLLQVVTPQYAVNAIGREVQQISNKDVTYIEFAKGDKQHNIQSHFKVLTSVLKYNERNDFKIKWTWKPKNINDAVSRAAIGLPIEGGPDPGSPTTNGYQDVSVTRDYNDIEGQLIATVQYLGRGDGSGDTSYDMPPFKASFGVDIVVKGIGRPASTQQYGQKITLGSSSTMLDLFPDTDRKVPVVKKLDAYNGAMTGFPKKDNAPPFKYVLNLNMGKDNGAAEYVKIERLEGEAGVVSLAAGENPVNLEALGDATEIRNPSASTTSEGKLYLAFTATKSGSATYVITYYVKDGGGTPVASPDGQTKIRFEVENSAPHDDAALESLIVKDHNKNTVEFPFDPATTEYTLDLLHSVDQVTVRPTVRDSLASKSIDVAIMDENGQPAKDKDGNVISISSPIGSGKTSQPIKLRENSTTSIKLTVTAQDKTTRTYTLAVRRLPPSDDATLKSLSISDTDGVEQLKEFDPLKMEYKVEVPFKTKKVRILAEANHPGVISKDFTPELKPEGLLGPKEWLTLAVPDEEGTPTKVSVKIMPEDNNEYNSRTYNMEITRLPPGKIATLASLRVTDAEDKELAYTPTFHKDMVKEDYYEVKIPYSTKTIKVGATAEDENAKMELMHGGKVLQEISMTNLSKAYPVDHMKNENDFYEMTVVVTAENGLETVAYPLHILRAEPSTDTSLSALVATGDDESAVELDPTFDPETRSYSAEVPYNVKKVTVTPTATYEGVEKITVAGKKTESGTPSSQIKLDYPGTTDIDVVVLAEDGKTEGVYKLHIKRAAPSSDARLKSLTTTGTENQKPLVFNPDVLAYTMEVVLGEKGVIITAIPNDPFATLTIDGKKVENGKPSELIELMKIKQTIEIVVTAQDGKTKKTYTITFTDKNKIELTNNANLKSLKVKDGIMKPKFQSSVTSYDVAVKEEVTSVQIIPIPDDPLAKVQVFSGSKEIGDWENNYAQYIVDGMNTFTVKVTSPDGKVTKDYTVLVYRNEPDKLGDLKPLTPDDVIFDDGDDIVTVDITKFPRVGADVFNTLRTEYPEKTIVFQGNDYSLQFKGADLLTEVPNTTVYDFTLSFDSPEKSDIRALLNRYKGNDGARVVYVYFNHHGALPGPATFTISLGHKYANDTLYWHYYNPERDRIDFYGTVDTNSKGTFATQLEHLSTYIVSDQRLSGSEDKSSEGMRATGGNLSAAAGSTKPNPGTGTEAEQP